MLRITHTAEGKYLVLAHFIEDIKTTCQNQSEVATTILGGKGLY